MPFLSIGVTYEYFNQEGNIPEVRDLLHKYVRGEIMYSKLSFSSLGGTSSYPDEVVHFKDLMIFLISCAVTGVKSICPKDLL